MLPVDNWQTFDSIVLDLDDEASLAARRSIGCPMTGLAARLLPGTARAHDATTAKACCGFSAMEMMECANAGTAQWDKRLNAAYQAAMRAAGGDAAGSLRTAEQAGIEYRNQRCTHPSTDPATTSHIIAPGCMTGMTRARATELEADAKSLGQN